METGAFAFSFIPSSIFQNFDLIFLFVIKILLPIIISLGSKFSVTCPLHDVTGVMRCGEEGARGYTWQ